MTVHFSVDGSIISIMYELLADDSQIVKSVEYDQCTFLVQNISKLTTRMSMMHAAMTKLEQSFGKPLLNSG